MKKSLIAALLLASSAPAFAGAYGELGIGMTFGQSVSTQTYTVTSGPNTASGKINLDYDTGLAAGAELGWAGWGYPGLRFSAGYDYLEGRFSTGHVVGTVNGTSGTFNFNRSDVTSLGGTLDNNVHVATGNIYYDIPVNSSFQPYIGGGLGAAFLDNTDPVFAMTATAGFRFPISDSTYLGARYRFYRAEGPNDNLGIKYDPITAHSVMATIGFNFN